MHHIDSSQQTSSIPSLKLNPLYLAQADLLLLAARFFRPPSVAWQDLSDIEQTEVNELLQHSGLPETTQLIELFQQIVQQLQSVQLENWSGEYYRLFDCNVLCPINESAFIRRDKGSILADVAGFYQAFGFQLADQAHEKVDHLVCELEFVAMLLVMLAKAHSQETASITYDALAGFGVDHLGEWVATFCERLSQTTTLPLYQHFGTFLHLVWSGIVQANQLPTSSGAMPHDQKNDDEGTPYECGMAEKMVM